MRIPHLISETYACPECCVEPVEVAEELFGLPKIDKFADETGIHNHDRGCLEVRAKCPNGHPYVFFLLRTCNDRSSEPSRCGWTGEYTCDCHVGMKVDTRPYTT